jgi:hypothetical protein
MSWKKSYSQNGKSSIELIRITPEDSIPYHVSTVDRIRILFIGLTIDMNQPYVDIINQTLLIPFVKQFLQSIEDIN